MTKGSIEDRMAYYNTPAITVGFVKDYNLHWARAYGWADREEKRKATIKTLFQAASLSKSVNAVGVLHWAEQNSIDVNTDFKNYINWDIKNRKKTKKSRLLLLIFYLTHLVFLAMVLMDIETALNYLQQSKFLTVISGQIQNELNPYLSQV